MDPVKMAHHPAWGEVSSYWSPAPRPISSTPQTGARDGRPGFRRHHDRDIRAGGPHRPGSDQDMTVENIVGLVVAAALVGYLVLALLFPGRF
ncbi:MULTISPECIES: potassium-transporting ATPase subunit F [Streptomyces]|nr:MULTISPECIES: potassium-transporting ATPase subunit F [Streptomyces]